jgi:hypothetical protein
LNPPIDTSSFPVGQGFDHEDKEEIAGLEVLAAEARDFVQAFRWAPPLEELVLAFGVAPILALFLARFSCGIEGEGQGDTECWIVVGDLPYMYFETEEAPDPANALRFYCAIAQDWADAVTDGRDLSESYPIPVAPTLEHAEMLKSRIEFIRKNLVPLAWD